MAMAQRLGQILAAGHYELVYGGADIGLMGRVADAVMHAGGTAIGVIPRSLLNKVSHQGLTELHVVESMHERKNLMFNLADAFIALPGGFGTIEEVMEIITWAQLRLHNKACGLINVDGFFNDLLSFLDSAVVKGFIQREHREMLLVADEPQRLLDLLKGYTAPQIEKWSHKTT